MTDPRARFEALVSAAPYEMDVFLWPPLNAKLGGDSEYRNYHTRVAWDIYQAALAGHAEEIARLTAERDKWLDKFNQSEQFQDGPTKRAERAEAERDALRAALAGMVGVSTREELEQMEAVIRSQPAPAEDKAVAINAIHALLATMPLTATPTPQEPTT